MRRLVALLAILLALPLAPSASAATTQRCDIVPPHTNSLVAVATNGCSLTGTAGYQILIVVTFSGATVDHVLITAQSTNGERHDFVCFYEVAFAGCAFPVQLTHIGGVWTVSARGETADPLGPFFYGGADPYAQLEATFD